MKFIKKFAKEISVFGLVLVIFLGLFAYRQMTFKDYKTIKQSQFEQMVEDKKDFVIVIGDASNTTVQSYQKVMQKYTTRNRKQTVYFLDLGKIDDADKYVEKKFGSSVTYPATFIFEKGEVKAKRDGIMQYYNLYDFIKEN